MRYLCGLMSALVLLCSPAWAGPGITFWDSPRYGGNSFNEAPPNEAYFRALRATGATWVRLSFSKWQGQGHDFLIGDADDYAGIPPEDLATLITVLDAAHAADIKVVIVPLSLPGARWAQQTPDGKPDLRHWNDTVWWAQSTRFWRDLASALKVHPAVAGYNLINEPIPEMKAGLDEHAPPEARKAWYAANRGTSHDIIAFYTQVIAAVRTVDTDTPIMVDGGWYGGALGFVYWPAPLPDDKVLYAFHMYEPYEATSAPNIRRTPQYRYPGHQSWYADTKVTWDKAMLESHMNQAFDWAEAHGVASNRVVAGEFGCVRQWKDCAAYLTDVTEILDRHDVHWAFYSFREPGWDAMDYELPDTLTTGQFYWAKEQGRLDTLPRNGTLINIIKARMTP